MDRLRKYRPGEDAKIVLWIQHPRELRLAAVEVTFSNQEGVDEELVFRGLPAPPDESASIPRPLAESKVEMALEIPVRAALGLYKVDGAMVKTQGGQTYHYYSDELANMGEVVLEVVAEPEYKPGLRLGFLD